MPVDYLVRVAHFFNGKHFDAVFNSVVTVPRFVTDLDNMAVQVVVL
jgi:hypothetical protein